MDYFSNEDSVNGPYVSPDTANYDGPSYGTGADEPFSISDDAEYGGGDQATQSAVDAVQEAVAMTDSPYLSTYGFGGVGTDPSVVSAPKMPAAEDKSIWDTVKGFFGDAMNEKGSKMKLVELGFGAIAGMAKDSAAKDAAKYKAEAESALLTKKDQLEQEANQRFSQSVGGLSPVKKYQPKPLTRMDGSRVFTPSGLINQGVK